MSEVTPCIKCAYAKSIPGDCHKTCSHPHPEPEFITSRDGRIGWPGCGVFPCCFDTNIVKACATQTLNDNRPA